MSWFSQIAFLAVLFSILYIFIPEGEVKRIAGMLFAVIFMLRIVAPLYSAGKSHLSSWIVSWELCDDITEESDSALIQDILETYEGKCIDRIQTYVHEQSPFRVSNLRMVYNKDPSSDTFGYIQHLYIYVVHEEKTQSGKDSWIQPIEILPSKGESQSQKHPEECKELAELLAGWLEIEESCVDIIEEVSQS